MKKSISKNLLYNLSYQILTLLTPLVTTPYISRVLGADGIGIYSYTTSIVTYFILLGTIGLSSYGQREIAYYQGNRHEQSRIFYEVFLFRIVVVSLSITAYYFIILRNVENNYLIFAIQTLNIVALFFDVSWFFQGLEEFDKVVFRNFIVRIVSIIMLFVLIKQVEDLWLYVLLNSTLALIGGILVCFYLPKYLEKVDWKEINIFRNIKIIMELFLPQIAIQIYTVFDKTMIGIFSGIPAENGYYEQAEKCVKVALVVVTSLGTVMLPRIANAYARGDQELVYAYIIKSIRFVWFLSLPMVMIIIAVAPNFVPWFMGAGFDDVILLLQVFSVLLIAIGLSNVIGIQYLVSINKQNLMTLSVSCGAVVNFLLNIILIPRWYSLGASLASIVAEFVVTFVQFYLVRDFLKVNVAFSLAKYYFQWALLSLVVMIICSNVVPKNIIGTILIIAVGSGIYILCLFIKKDMIVFFIYNKIMMKFFNR